MKRLLFLFVSILFFTACDSSDDSIEFNSDIRIGDVVFTPTNANVSNTTATVSGENAMDFLLANGTEGNSNYEAINFTVNFPTNSNTAPNGVYDFGIGVIGETLFAQGFYMKGLHAYDLVGYTVQVTVLSNTEYRLDFQNIQALNLDGEMVVISGYFEGEMN